MYRQQYFLKEPVHEIVEKGLLSKSSKELIRNTKMIFTVCDGRYTQLENVWNCQLKRFIEEARTESPLEKYWRGLEM